MDLVVDTNILVAALLKAGTTRNLLFSSLLNLYAPEHITSEITKYKSEFMEKGDLDNSSFAAALSAILSQVYIMPKSEFSGKLDEARKICLKHPEDVPFVALTIRLRIPVWTHDKEFSKHKEIKTFSTKELLEMLRSR